MLDGDLLLAIGLPQKLFITRPPKIYFPKKAIISPRIHERTARRKTKIEITRERYLFHVRLQKMLVMLDSVMSETKEQLSNGFLSFEQYHSSPIKAYGF